jgi:hypothetical protein
VSRQQLLRFCKTEDETRVTCAIHYASIYNGCCVTRQGVSSPLGRRAVAQELGNEDKNIPRVGGYLLQGARNISIAR